MVAWEWVPSSTACPCSHGGMGVGPLFHCLPMQSWRHGSGSSLPLPAHAVSWRHGSGSSLPLPAHAVSWRHGSGSSLPLPAHAVMVAWEWVLSSTACPCSHGGMGVGPLLHSLPMQSWRHGSGSSLPLPAHAVSWWHGSGCGMGVLFHSSLPSLRHISLLLGKCHYLVSSRLHQRSFPCQLEPSEINSQHIITVLCMQSTHYHCG